MLVKKKGGGGHQALQFLLKPTGTSFSPFRNFQNPLTSNLKQYTSWTPLHNKLYHSFKAKKRRKKKKRKREEETN
jgi:hypothetical protein